MNRYLIATATVALLGAALPASVMAQSYGPRGQYDGYCYVEKQRSGRTGTVVGAIVGGLAGSQVSKNERGLGTVAGAVIGGAIGNQVGRGNVKCHEGVYYSYEQGYYDAPVAPQGYEPVYFEKRPSREYYRDIRTNGPFPPYPNGGYQHGGGPSYDIHARNRSHRQAHVYGYEAAAPTRYEYRDHAPTAYYEDHRGHGYDTGYDRRYSERYEDRHYPPAPVPAPMPAPVAAPYPTQYCCQYPPHSYGYDTGYNYSTAYSDTSGYGYASQSGYYSESASSASTYSRSSRTYVNGMLVDQSSSQSWRGSDGVWHEGPPPPGLIPYPY